MFFPLFSDQYTIFVSEVERYDTFCTKETTVTDKRDLRWKKLFFSIYQACKVTMTDFHSEKSGSGISIGYQ